MANRNKWLEYYAEHEISPVRQDLSDINRHFAKREKLYRQLGLPCVIFEGKKILEVGPGSGYNTLAFFSWGGVCTLIEPNKAGIKEMKKLFRDYQIPRERYVIEECVIEEARIEEKFDIVIAEGFLHAVDNHEEIILKLSDLVKEGGVIVITCMDAIGMFVEQMKRLICHILIKNIEDYETQVKMCVNFFEGQMKYARGMSRSIEDWVKDDMLNPTFNNSKILSIENALDIFPENFSLLGSSQKIFTDYSWYKDLEHNEREILKQQYKLKRHNLLMTGLEESVLSMEDSLFLESKVTEIRRYATEYEKEYSNIYLEKIENNLYAVRHVLEKIGRVCLEFADETRKIISRLKEGESVNFPEYQTFYSAIGRTQQYLSMVKDKVPWR